MRRSGTTADRVAAMSVLLQDGAVANLPSLDGLLAMVSKKGGEAEFFALNFLAILFSLSWIFCMLAACC